MKKSSEISFCFCPLSGFFFCLVFFFDKKKKLRKLVQVNQNLNFLCLPLISFIFSLERQKCRFSELVLLAESGF